MGGQSKNDLVTDDELASIFADADASAIPDLDDGGGTTYIAVPTPQQAVHLPASDVPVAAPDGEAAASEKPQSRVGVWLNLVYRICDRGLEHVNRPFLWLTPAQRHWAGLGGLVTILISVMYAVAYPVIFPHRDAYTVLEEQKHSLTVSRTPSEEAAE